MADPTEVAAFLNRNGLYEDAFIDDYINQLDSSNRLDHLRQGLKEGLAELERQVQEHLVEQAMSAAVGPALGAASFVARKGVAKIAIQRLRKKSARAARMRATGRLTGTAAPVSGITQSHHAWPKYLGGPSKQVLERLPESLHIAYHSGLDKILPRQWGKTYYDTLSDAARKQMKRDLADSTKTFDAKYGTNL
jgi:hypothetical protein